VNLLDGAIAFAVLGFALLGWRDGLVRAVWAYGGVLVGAAAGIVLAPYLLGWAPLSVWTTLAALLVVAFAAVVGRAVAVWAERRLRLTLGWTPRSWLDRPGGAVFAGIAALSVSWMLGSALAGSSLPVLATWANRSVVLTAMDHVPLPVSHLLVRSFSRLGRDRDFPRYVDVFTAEQVRYVPPPSADVSSEPGVVAATKSVWRVYAHDAGMLAEEGTVFLVAPGRVMTAAHVVAGSGDIAVDVAGERLPASIVVCDPEQDVAVLDVPGLVGTALPFADGAGAVSGDPAAIVGYPGSEGLTVAPARIRERLAWQSSDIWGDGRYEHDAYTVRGQVVGGDSGSPVVDEHGTVLGMVVAASRAYDDNAYALTADQLAAAATAGRAGRPGAADSCG